MTNVTDLMTGVSLSSSVPLSTKPHQTGASMTCYYAHLSSDTDIILQVITCYLGLIMTFPFIFFSGDMDGRVPVIGTRYWVEALDLPMKSQWQPWYRNNQVGHLKTIPKIPIPVMHFLSMLA
jgi:hypothetical protein